MVLLAVAFLGCNGEEKDPVPGKDFAIPQEEVITLNLGGWDFDVTVSGTFLDKDWNGVADDVKNALENAYSGLGMGHKALIRKAFEESITDIIVSESPGYNIKVDPADTTKLYLNSDTIGALTGDKLLGAAVAINNADPNGFTAKATPAKAKFNGTYLATSAGWRLCEKI